MTLPQRSLLQMRVTYLLQSCTSEQHNLLNQYVFDVVYFGFQSRTKYTTDAIITVLSCLRNWRAEEGLKRKALRLMATIMDRFDETITLDLIQDEFIEGNTSLQVKH